MEVRIALAQYPVTTFSALAVWQAHTREWVENAILSEAKILVFPEYASMELVSLFAPEIQADLKLQIRKMQELLPVFKSTFKNLAQEFDCIIVAPSFPVFTGQKFVNRAFVFSKNGEGFQDKWFMTRFENESWGISSGNEKVITVFESDYGTFGIQICYDIEFPIGSQILAANGAQLIFSPSCTETLRGATRVHVGARARALEQQVFTGVSQLVGNAEWSPAVDINFGYGGIYASPDKDLPPDGIVKNSEAHRAGWLTETVNTTLNEAIRKEGQVFNFSDSSTIRMALAESHTVKICKL